MEIHAHDDRKDVLLAALREIRALRVRLREASSRGGAQPLAIVGLGCRLPRAITHPDELWRALLAGVDATVQHAPARLDFSAYPDAIEAGAYLDAIEDFDPQLFGISPREAVAIDPQHRIALEVAWQALEHANLLPRALAHTRTGVFIGITSEEYWSQLRGDADPRDLPYHLTGNASNFAAGRISYLLGLQGPSLCVDTACSSSLVALHLAAQSLRTGESDCALAGGVNVILSPRLNRIMTHAKMLSQSGRVRAFDAAADGMVRGEGCAFVVLKRLADAERAGDRIWAILRGSAVNQDGPSSGLTVPSRQAQQAVIEEALAQAGVAAHDIEYVEAHGTGTPLGDPIEVRALCGALGVGRSSAQPLTIGTIKANIGHLESSAGIAGVVKAVLMLDKRCIPPQLHFLARNPEIEEPGFPLRIATQTLAFAAQQPVVGVSSFGASGTNAHVILAAAPPSAAAKNDVAARRPSLLVVSARSAAGLAKQVQRYAAFLDAPDAPPLAAVCRTAATRRTHFERRLALVASDAQAAARALEAKLPSAAASSSQGSAKLAFLFTGQGSQYASMGRRLYACGGVFREALDRCARILDGELEVPLLAAMHSERASRDLLADTRFAQPALLALQWSLTQLFRSWGIEPAAVMGHSVGEFAAACASDALTIEAGLKLLALRGRLVAKHCAAGAMLAVRAEQTQIEALLSKLGAQVVVSAIHGPQALTLSCDLDAVERVQAALEAGRYDYKRLPVSHAFHSPAMLPMQAAFQHAASALHYGTPRCSFVSTVTGEAITALGAAYWAEHVLAPVRFSAGIASLRRSGIDTFLELGPHPALTAMDVAEPHERWIATLRRGADDEASVLSAAGALYEAGYDLAWDALTEGWGPLVEVPSSAFDRQRYWPSARVTAEAADDSVTYQISWQRADRSPGPSERARGPLLVCDDETALGSALLSEHSGPATRLERSQLERYVAAWTPDATQTLNVVVVWPVCLSGDARAICVEQLCALQALIRQLGGARANLLLLTRAAQALPGDAYTALDVDRSALVGLWRVLQTEHPELACVLVDLDEVALQAADQASLARRLLAELGESRAEVAYRGTARFEARLRQLPLPQLPASVRRDGAYLVTGGLGALGRELAAWLANRGAGTVVLVSRAGERAEDAAWLATLRAAGSEVQVRACDAGDRAQLAALLVDLRSGPRPLCGVFHLAGVLSDRPLLDHDAESFSAVFHAKVAGARNLHELTQDDPLDHFVLFSSLSAVVGSAGQSNYAAANAYLDALAHARRASGRHACSVGWGPWSGAGMARATEARWQAHGLSGLSPGRALRALERALAADVAHVVVAAVEWSVWLRGRAAPGLLRSFEAAVVPEREPSAREHLLELSPTERAARCRDLVIERVRRVLGLPASTELAAQKPLRELGLDSLMSVELRNELARAFSVRLPATLLYNYSTLDALAEQLLSLIDAEASVVSQTHRQSLPPLAATSPQQDALAIVGVACRFPGQVNDPDSYWSLLRDQRDPITEVPATRWDLATYYDPTPGRPGKTHARHMAALEDVAQFDAEFFGISAREAQALDPQHRLLLELSWEAFEDAGVSASQLLGSSTGVFVGLSNSDYERIVDGLDLHAATGLAPSTAAGRISYVYGLQGPSMVVDTACSSSLVALHLACQSLRSSETDLALAASVNLILAPDLSLRVSRLGALSPTGRCRVFDAGADGYVRGEGCAALVFKRHADAVRDGDRIWALVRGSAVNQDGRSNGLTAPNGLAQRRVIEQALARARLQPADVDYVEAHGTGTTLGDPIELSALAAAYAQGRSPGCPLYIGSVKANLGHLEPAAGMAGLLKVVLSLTREQLPGQPHFSDPTGHVDWQALPLCVARAPRAWPRDAQRARRAGVSAFGFSGTNAHVLLEEAPLPPSAATTQPSRALHVLTVSARSERAWSQQLTRYADALDVCDDSALADFCFTANTRRSHHGLRTCAVGADAAELAQSLRASAARLAEPQPQRGNDKLVFVFSGQGAQWQGMGRELLARGGVFARTLREVDSAIAAHSGWSLCAELAGEGLRSERIESVQPALFAMALSLCAQWRAWGVEPDAVVGHSMGELAAACVAGVISLEDAVRIVCDRSRLLTRLDGQGSMVLVELPLARAQEAIGEYARDVSVAASNSAGYTVLSGAKAAVAGLIDGLNRRGVFNRFIKVDVAGHSPQTELVREDLMNVVAGVRTRAGEIPWYSTVTTRAVDGATLDESYWFRNLREPVMFGATIERLVQDGHRYFVEMSPHPLLVPNVREVGVKLSKPCVACGSLERGAPEERSLLRNLAQLYEGGRDLPWRRLYPAGRVVDLPRYAWARQAYWAKPRRSDARPSPVLEEDSAAVSELAELQWMAAERVAPSESASGVWVLLAGEDPVASALIRAIERQGGNVIQVRANDAASPQQALSLDVGGADWPAVRARLPRKLRAVVNLWPLELEAWSADALERMQSIAHCHRQLARALVTEQARLYCVTRGAVTIDDEAASLLQALCWGASTCLSVEHPEVEPTQIDVAPHADAETVAQDLLAEVLRSVDEAQIALRPSARYFARLVHPARALPRATLSTNCTVVGGLGRLSQAYQRACAGARLRFVHEPVQTAEARRVAALLCERGAELVPCDLDDSILLERALGVDKCIVWLPSPERSLTNHVSRLHALVEIASRHGHQLFIHSGPCAVLPVKGTATRGACDAFDAAVCRQARSQGLQISCLAFGPLRIDDAGQAMAVGALNCCTELPAESALEHARASFETQIGPLCVMGFAPRHWRDMFPKSRTHLFDNFEVTDAVNKARASFGDRLRRLTAAEAARVAGDMVAAQVASVLRNDPRSIARTVPLPELGMDSVMSIELRNRLEVISGLELSATLIWTYSTIEALADAIVERTLVDREPAQPEADSELSALADDALLDALDQLVGSA